MLRAKMPGALMFQLPRPEGLPDVDTPRTRMVRQIGGLPALGSLPEDERDGVSLSLAMTLARALYHRARFDQVIAALNQRRAQTAGFITYDIFAQYTVFEAAGVLGAVRLAIDEIIYIVARIRGASPQDIHTAWKAENVMKTGFDKRPDFDLPEVHALRARQTWYEEMNDYRNVLHHRGWRDQFTGYFPMNSELPEALLPEHNVMLVPDRKSLEGKKRPHEWTYKDRVRIEEVVGRAIEGFELLLDAVCMTCWGAAVPAMGTMPKDQQPNLIVSLVRPALLLFGDHVLLPVFTSEDAAGRFTGFPTLDGLYLAELTPSTIYVDQPAFTFALPGLKEVVGRQANGGDLILAFDPTRLHPDRVNIDVAAYERFPLAKLLAAGDLEPLSILKGSINAERLYVWRKAPS
jgi:hypothetical protein